MREVVYSPDIMMLIKIVSLGEKVIQVKLGKNGQRVYLKKIRNSMWDKENYQ